MPSTVTDRLDGLTTSVAVKAPVVVASTGNITLSSTQTIDGYSVSTGERVLVKNQDTATENGIYGVRLGTWQRTGDCDGARDLVKGTIVYISTGSTTNTNFRRLFEFDSTSSTSNTIAPGTDTMTLVAPAGLGSVSTAVTVTAFAETFLDDANAAAVRTTIGAGDAIVADATTWAKTQTWTKGADIASASPLIINSVADGNYFDVTGTTGFSTIECTAGTLFMLQFDGALTMTDGATLDLGGANITTHTGSRFIFFAIAEDTAQLIGTVFEGDQRRVDATGAVTNAVQPCFRVNNATLTDKTGNNTDYTIVFATEVFDQNADFDGTSTFTAPITGRYLLTALVKINGITSACDSLQLSIVTSNDTYIDAYNSTNMPVTTMALGISIVADMDAADTATVHLQNAGESSDVHDIAAGAAHFSGVLIA